MKMIVCPISAERIPEHISRLIALFVVLILIAYLISGNFVFLAILIIDFTSRSYFGGNYSPFGILSKEIGKAFSLKSKLVDKAPKIFAARLGLIFSLLLFLTALLNLPNIALVIALLFGICALLEFAISFCVGCVIYTLLTTVITPSLKS